MLNIFWLLLETDTRLVILFKHVQLWKQGVHQWAWSDFAAGYLIRWTGVSQTTHQILGYHTKRAPRGPEGPLWQVMHKYDSFSLCDPLEVLVAADPFAAVKGVWVVRSKTEPAVAIVTKGGQFVRLRVLCRTWKMGLAGVKAGVQSLTHQSPIKVWMRGVALFVK